MAFVDEARIFIKAGDGGKGCESFFRDKYMRHPRPDGGDGGKGGDIIFEADKRIQTLLDYRFKQHYKAPRGGHGSSKGKRGKDGQELTLRVPMGTIIRDFETRALLKDLTHDGQTITIAKGGRGGRGNKNRTSKIATPPGIGQEKVVHLELKIIADIGLVGFPNAGKSTLISNISKVKSRIASYPFTTKQPILGVVHKDELDFIVADLPGLIEGAHTGRGLGDRFLKHAERTKILAHVIDMSGGDQRDPIEDYEKIEHELEAYSDKLAIKKRVLIANKMDLPSAQDHLKRFKKKIRKKIFEVSALEKEGLDDLVAYWEQLLGKSC